MTAHLYPRLEAERYGAGRLTKIRAQTVSGPSCRDVAERIGVPDRLRASAPEAMTVPETVMTERVLASVIEAVIGACFLHAGYERTAAGVVEAFAPEVAHALDHPVDFKSTFQERLAQRGEVVVYEVSEELGPAARPHVRGARDRGRPDRGHGYGTVEEGRRAGGCAARAGRRRGRRGGRLTCI